MRVVTRIFTDREALIDYLLLYSTNDSPPLALQCFCLLLSYKNQTKPVDVTGSKFLMHLGLFRKHSNKDVTTIKLWLKT